MLLFKINSVAFSPDGQMLASGSDDFSIRLWNVSDGSIIRVIIIFNIWVLY
jgi:WD40 repeat protein